MMKITRILMMIFFSLFGFVSKGQEMPKGIQLAFQVDDANKIDSLITKAGLNDCFGNYSPMSEAIRYNAIKCFNLLLTKGADVNKICNDYVPPIMHAAKYGRLIMLKLLVAKGANLNYKYEGQNPNIIGMTPLTYAEAFKKTEIVEYLKSLTE